MARIHGRNGRLYAGITSSGTAEPIAFLSKWSISFASDTVDVTAFGDTNSVMVQGLPKVNGSITGYYDDATAQLYTAATDGIARKVYLYPSTSTSSQYWYGTATFDFSVDADVNGAVTISGDWNAASAWTKVG